MPEKKNTIGRFEIIEKIGEGPIGAVYKALDPVIRRTVAIKVIKLYALEETATFADVFEKIYRVVRTSTSLNHPNICIIYDLSEEKKIPYVTMEYVEGQDLDVLLQKKHQFKRTELINILQQICDALDFAHKKNVIHQDLKTTNILLTTDLQVKITDFGIAGLDEISAAQTKKLLSIPYYISPEQALGEKVTAASDLFSLGVIMYQLLSGQLPFPGTSAANVIMMIARDNPAVPKNLTRSGINKDEWEAFFNTALAKAPTQRFKSAREMFEGIDAIIPPGEKNYYPYAFTFGETTGKFEKTFVNDSTTVMVDTSKMLDETGSHGASSAEMDAMVTVTNIPAEEFRSLPPAPEPPPAAATVMISKEMLKPAAPPTMPPTPASAMTEMIPVPTALLNKSAASAAKTEAPATMVPTPIPTPPAPPTPPPVRMSMPPTPPPVTPKPAPLPPPPPAAVQPAPEPAPPPPAMPHEQPAKVSAAKAPSMQRYFLGAIVMAILIVLVGGGIFLFRGRHTTPEQPKTEQPKPVVQQPKPVVTLPVTPTVTSGKISISSDPAGATVFVGEEQKGVTPLEIPDLPLGTYTVKLQLKGYQDYQQDVQLTQETPNPEVPITLEKVAPQIGTLVIDSNPPGATIIVSKKTIGVTPKTLTNKNAGRYTVLLKKEGYEDYSETVRVTQDKTTTLTAQLKEIPKPVAVTPPPPPAKEEVKPGTLMPLGDVSVPPRAIKKTFAKYPDAARQKKLEGVVSLSLLVSETGKVTDVKVLKSANPILDDAAVKAVREWVYEPAKKDGVPVKVWLPVSLSFQQSH
jgi:serine/threonine-protein kinase